MSIRVSAALYERESSTLTRDISQVCATLLVIYTFQDFLLSILINWISWEMTHNYKTMNTHHLDKMLSKYECINIKGKPGKVKCKKEAKSVTLTSVDITEAERTRQKIIYRTFSQHCGFRFRWKPQYWLKALCIIFSPGSPCSSNVYRCEPGRCRTLPFFLTFLWKYVYNKNRNKIGWDTHKQQRHYCKDWRQT